MRNIFWSMTLVVACLFGAATAQAQKQVTTNNAIVPGEVWNDTDGNPINAHGGGILYHEGTYYWYGEYSSSAASDVYKRQGTVSTKKVKPSCPNGLHGSVTARM